MKILLNLFLCQDEKRGCDFYHILFFNYLDFELNSTKNPNNGLIVNYVWVNQVDLTTIH